VSTITIRPYQDANAESVKSLIRELQSYERGLEASLAEPTDAFADHYLVRLIADTQSDGIVLVAVNNGMVVGYAAGTRETDIQEASAYFYVLDLSVAETMRGQGIGSALMQAMEDFARQQGHTRLMVGVLASNARTHGLYRRLSFRDYVIELVKDL
jgi:GNAT superfamily N-acetyltransferase